MSIATADSQGLRASKDLATRLGPQAALGCLLAYAWQKYEIRLWARKQASLRIHAEAYGYLVTDMAPPGMRTCVATTGRRGASARCL